MAQKITREAVAAHAIVHETLPVRLHNTTVDRTFELPPVLYKAVVGLFLGFLAIMTLGFGNPGLIIPMVIFTFFIVAGFGIPMIWTRLAPQTGSMPQSWQKFQREGIMTASGRTSARDATVQVVMLPVLVFLWGVVAVVIAALV
jgi:hypothetical protein